MASTTDRRILAINKAISNSAYDEEIDEQKYEPFLDGKYKTFAEAFEGGYNRQRGRIIFGILLIIVLGIIYLKLKKKK
jgi:hypothetical protein